MARPPSSIKPIEFEPIDWNSAFSGISKTSGTQDPIDWDAAFADLKVPEPIDLDAAFAGVKLDRDQLKQKFEAEDRARAEANLRKEAEGWRWPWEVASDAVKGGIGTVAGMAGDVVGAMNKEYAVPFGGEISAAAGLAGKLGWDGAQDVSDALEAGAKPKSELATDFSRNADEIQAAMEQGQTAQRQLAKLEMGEAIRGGVLSTAKHLAMNPLDVAETTVESLPLMGVGKVVGAATRGLTGIKAAEVPAMLATEGAMSAASSVEQAREAIRTLPPEQLAALPDYGPLAEKYGDEGARKILEGRAGTQAGFAATVLQATIGFATRRLSAAEEAIAGNVGPTSSRLANAGIAVPKEFVQETSQGAGEALASNFGVSAADPSKGLMDGVIEGGLVEGASSVPVSSVLGALQAPKAKAPAPAPAPVDGLMSPVNPVEGQAPKPTVAEIMQSDIDPASKGAALADAVLSEAGVGAFNAELDTRLSGAIAAAEATTVTGDQVVNAPPMPRSFAERRAGNRSLAQVSQLVAEQQGATGNPQDAGAAPQPLPTLRPTRAVDYNAPESQDLPNFGMPELTRALPDEHPLMQPRDKDASPERVAMRQALIEQRLAGRPSVPEGVRPIAYVMGGGGASGKGTVLKLIEESEGATRDKFVHLDPDSFKTGDDQHGLDGIPEYAELIANGEKRAAGIVHEESSNLYKDALNQAIGKRQNLVLDRTLSDEKKALAELQALKDAGYEIRMVGVTVDPREAIARSVLRAEGKAGRYVPLAALIKAHKGFSLAFENIQKLADRVVLYDNGVAKGESPIPIAERSGDGSLTILDRARYNNFVAKGGINEQATNYRELGYTVAPEADGGDVQARGDAQGDQGARDAGQPDSSPAQEASRGSPVQVDDRPADNARPDPVGRAPDQGEASAAVGEKPASAQEVPQPVAAGESAGKGAALPDSPKVRRGLGVTSKLDAITRAVERFAAGLKSDLKIKVLANLQQVPGYENHEDSPDGAYIDGTVYLFADELPENDVARWAWVFAHEAKGHAGLRGLLGKDLDTALERAARNPFIAELAAAIQKDRDGDGLTKLEATEEALSEVQGAIETNGFEELADRYKVDITPIRVEQAKTTFQKFVETVKALFKAKTNTQFSTSDVLKLLDEATAAVGGKGTAFSKPRAKKSDKVEYDQAADGSVTITSGVERLRTILAKRGEEAVGRNLRDGGGVYFSPLQAPRVLAAISGRSNLASRRGEVHEHVEKNGEIVGAPPKFNTKEKLESLRKTLRGLAIEGATGRMWYEHSGKAVLKLVGGDKTQAKKFLQLLAIYSPQADIAPNYVFALRAWLQIKAGVPVSVNTGSQDRTAERVVRDGGEWTGEKTNNFYNNLMRAVDPKNHGAETQGVAGDLWMARAFRFPGDAPNDSQYRFMEIETNRLAKELGWEPQQVQAAIWVSLKSRMNADNAANKRVDEESVNAGDLEIRNGLRHFPSAAAQDRHRNRWIDDAMQRPIDAQVLGKGEYNYGTAVNDYLAQVSWEARPGRTAGGPMQWVNDADLMTQVEYQEAIAGALRDAAGHDLLAAQMGLPFVDYTAAPGVWQDEIAAGGQNTVSLPLRKGGVKDHAKAIAEREAAGETISDEDRNPVDPTAQKMVTAYAAIVGRLLRQEGVGWHRPDYAASARDANGVEMNIGRTFTAVETASMYNAMKDRLSSTDVSIDDLAFVASPTGLRVLNFGAMPNPAFVSMLKAVAEANTDLDIEIERFRSDGALIANNWEESPDGQDYLRQAAEAGHRSASEWADRVLAPRIERAQQEFAKRHGRKFSKPRSNAAGYRDVRGRPDGNGAETQAVGWSERPVQPDAARVEGIHYSNTSGLSALDGKKHGTNHRGSEFKRLDRAEEKRFAPLHKRVFFYLFGSPQARGESVVGRASVYGQTLDNIYDLDQDPRDYKGAFDHIRNDLDWLNEIELKIVKDGFDGLMSNGVIAVLGTKPVPVRDPKFSQPRRDPKEQAEADGFDTSKVYYHGTTAPKDFKTFKPGKGGVNELGRGVYVTDQKMYAEAWARGDEGRVLPLWLKKGDIYDLDMHKRKAGLPEAFRDVWIPLAKRIRERPELSSELQRTWDEVPIEEHAERLREIAKAGELNETLERAGYIGAKNEYSQIPGQVVLFAKGSIRSAETGKVMFSKPRREVTNTPEFKRWFGDSKVVDADGKPLVVYHGSNGPLERVMSADERMALFDQRTKGLPKDLVAPERRALETRAGALWFTDDENVADGYAGQREGSETVTQVYLSIQNPLDFTRMGAGEAADILSKANGKEVSIGLDYGEAKGIAQAIVRNNGALIQWAKANGYDGLIYPDTDVRGRSVHTSYVTFSPGQIKSVNNRGTFDPNDSRILFSKPDPGQVTAKDREDLRQQARAIAKSVDIASSDIEDVANRNMRLAKLSQDAADKIAEWTESDQLTAAVRDAKEIESDLAKAATNEDYSQGARREALRARDAIVGELSGLRTALAAAKKAGADAIKLQDRAAKLGQPIDATQMAEYRALLIEAADQAATAYDYVRKVMAARRAHESSVFKAKKNAADKRAFVGNQLGAQNPVTFSYTEQFDGSISGWINETREKVQDKFLSLLLVQGDIEAARGAPLDDVVNVWRNENLMHGRAGHRLETLKADYVDPLIKSMRDAGVSYSLLEDYLEARYAKVRNKIIAARNPSMPDGGSGLKNADADAFLTGQAAGHRSGATIDTAMAANLAALAKRVDAIRANTLQSMVADGLTTQDAVNAMMHDHPNYVPLRGKDGEEIGVGGTGKGLDVRGNLVRTAMGRGDGNRAVNILAEIFGDAERVIVQGEKNRVGQSAALLVLENPNPDVWAMEPVETEQKIDSLGQVYQAVKNSAQDPNAIRVMVKGRPFYIRFKNARLRDAFKNLGAEQSNVVMDFLGSLNRYASATLTRYNPAFVAVNLTRDGIFGFTGIAAEHGIKVAAQAAKNYGPAAIALTRAQMGKAGSGVMDSYAAEFASVGGKTAFGGINSVEDIAGKIEAEFLSIAEMVARGKTGVALRSRVGNWKAIKIIEGANEIAENTIRLSAYAALRQQGMSASKAAAYAKDLTVNFNRRGSATTVINSLILFFNASVQGAHRTIRLLSNRRVKAAVGAMAGLQFVLAAMAMGLDDEDEDGLTSYEKIPDWEKERNILIPVTEKVDGRIRIRYAKIPMPYGFNVFSHLGGRAAELMMGNKYEVSDFINDNANALVNSFSPIKFTEGVGSVLPFYVKMLVDLRANETGLGFGIRKDEPFSKFDKPRAYQGKSDTAEPFVVAAKAMNAIGGGDRLTPPKYLRGLLDWAPEDLRYLTEQISGGTGRFVSRSIGAGQKLFAGVDMAPGDVPILSSFIGEALPESTTSRVYYDRRAVVEKELARLRITAREDGVQAAKDLIEKTPALEGVKLHRFKTGRLTNASGNIEVEQKKGSAFAKYKAAEKLMTSIKDEMEAVRSGNLSFKDRTQRLKELQTQREKAQREFTIASAEWTSSGR